MIIKPIAALACGLSFGVARGEASSLYGSAPVDNPYDAAEQCATAYLSQHPTLAEDWIGKQHNILGGSNTENYVGEINTEGTELPRLLMMDGPQGVRNFLKGVGFENRTAWPAAASIGVALSPELAYHVGRLQAKDWRAINSNVALAPGAELHRIATGGRNWEYIAGEQAELGVLTGEVVKGLQSEGLMVSVKHWALNTQEANRAEVTAVISEETLMQNYLRAFRDSILAGAGSIMCAFNAVRVTHLPNTTAFACGSQYISKYLLREVMGFKGVLLSDWNARVSSFTDGEGWSENRDVLDWEMDWGRPPTDKIVSPEARKQITRHSITGMLVSGIFSPPGDICPRGSQDDPRASHRKGQLAQAPSLVMLPTSYAAALSGSDKRAAGEILVAESMVLLKNEEQLLPLVGHSALPRRSVLLHGEALLSGGGSGDSSAFGHQFPDNTGEALANNGGKWAQEAMKVALEQHLSRSVGEPVRVVWDFETGATEDLGKYDLVVSFASNYRAEAYLVGDKDGFLQLDRCSSTQDPFVRIFYGYCDYPREIAKFQASRKATGLKVVSVTTVGGGFNAWDFIDDVDAALTMYYPGEFFAQALGRVLVGDISPGGKLIATLPRLEADGEHIQSPVGRFNKGLKVGFEGVDRECSSAGKDPFATGELNKCCLGLVGCVKNWNGDGNYFFLCLTQEECEEKGGEPKLGYTVDPVDVENPGANKPSSGASRNELHLPAKTWDEQLQQHSDVLPPQYGWTESHYTEGDLIGYKYYEKYGMVPLFPFGYGLSYYPAEFTGDWTGCSSVEQCIVNVAVAGLPDSDTEARIASAVIQIYVGYESSRPDEFDRLRPVKELRAFKKVWRNGAVEVPLGTAAFLSVWDKAKVRFITPCEADGVDGTFTVSLGYSSSDIISSTTFACELSKSNLDPNEDSEATRKNWTHVTALVGGSIFLVAVAAFTLFMTRRQRHQDPNTSVLQVKSTVDTFTTDSEMPEP